MERLLLIGPDSPEIRRLKGELLKQRFQVKFILAEELERFCDPERPRSGRGSGFASSSESHQKEGAFALGLVEVFKSERLQDLVQKVRRNPSCGELPLVALIRPEQLRELGSSSGLEDFLVLPAEPESVEARIRFVLGRLNHLVPGSGKRFGALEINVDRYEVLLNREPLELTYKEFELLKFLATHPGRVFSRDQLLNQVWGYQFIGGTRTVDVHVRRLRAKLGPKHAALIDTVRNVGYKFLESL